MTQSASKLIIFDFDGVLADSMGLVLEFYNKINWKYGLKKAKSEKDISDLFHKNVFAGLMEAGLDESKSADFLDDMKNLTLEFKEHLKPFQNIVRVLRKLKEKGNMLAIISSNHSEVIKNFAKKNDISEIFEFIYGAENLTSKVEKINALSNKVHINKENTYYVGDTVGDIYEGKKADVSTVAACWGFHTKEELKSADPDYLLESVDELLDIF